MMFVGYVLLGLLILFVLLGRIVAHRVRAKRGPMGVIRRLSLPNERATLQHFPKLPSHVHPRIPGGMAVAERRRTLLVDEFAPACAKPSPRRYGRGLLADDRHGVIEAAIDFANCRGPKHGKPAFSRV